jgi:large subunit ribosomal protein L32
MPLPKRRHSNQRTRLRRTHYKLKVPAVGECPRCHAPRQPYHACLACGSKLKRRWPARKFRYFFK